MIKALALTTLAVVTAATHMFDEYEAQDESLSNGGYSDKQAQISLLLSQAAYCGKDAYADFPFSAAAKGFVYTKTIYVNRDDTQGFVGYLPSDKSIYVVFRGSSSFTNWLTNLSAETTKYWWSDCDCLVHEGFDAAERRSFDEVYEEV